MTLRIFAFSFLSGKRTENLRHVKRNTRALFYFIFFFFVKSNRVCLHKTQPLAVSTVIMTG